MFYNSSLSPAQFSPFLPVDWGSSFKLSTEQVWDGFFTYSLMLHHAEYGSVLELPHVAPSNSDRLREALHTRNLLMAGPGQENWSHVCDRCCWVYEDEDGTLRESYISLLNS